MRRSWAWLSRYNWAAIAGSAAVALFVLAAPIPVLSAPLRPLETRAISNQYGESFWQRTIQDPIALYTLWVAIFTFGLTISTALLWYQTRRMAEGAEAQANDMRKSIIVAQKSADAALLSAQASIGAESARIRVGEIQLHEGFRGGFFGASAPRTALTSKQKLESGTLEITIRNTGRTEADLLGVSINYAVGVELPATPTYGPPTHFSPSKIIDAHTGRVIWSDFHRPKLTADELSAVETKDSYWVYGYVSFLDFLNNRQRAKFSYRLSSGGLLNTIGDNFFPAGPNTYFGQEPEP